MACILLGWELGANRGHVVRLAEIAARLMADGHSVHAALQNVDGAVDILPDGVVLWQGPVWPRLLVNVSRLTGPPVATMADILARLGLDRSESLAGLIHAWDSLLRAIDPDIVIADFAPALLCAAAGRVPAIAVGTSFERVPGSLAAFPSLTGERPVFDESALLDATNHALRATGRAPIAALPQLFRADRSLVASFREIDVYADARTESPVAPSIGSGAPALSDGKGEEVFVYGFEAMMADAALWDGLAKSGLPVRVHVPRATPALSERLTALGFAFEPEPLPFDRIARDSRILVSHGGHGFVSAALLCGLPQVVTHYDLEKRGYADCVVKLGLGGQVPLLAIRAEPFAESLRRLYADDALAARARAAAPGFHAQMDRLIDEEVASAVAELRP
ncbi:glycosyl transferase-like UDP-glucuronosyltransferase [Sphingomonas cavernae]|uniref:Glycosyl transferase-like UDP-glucuronosyltransferase n=1 Tax=Sphingomonas cavernae TaxID=2320861 RepID=A0A418WL14_9SPHN|nr:glycosyl transferase-like UDP-glucuronosyltransferase [Sphingomonas cavernae]RJF90710.1 glycosyl transferase-like UDP-glucuronosyltransferase [Sphingomonas cavernae]